MAKKVNKTKTPKNQSKGRAGNLDLQKMIYRAKGKGFLERMKEYASKKKYGSLVRKINKDNLSLGKHAVTEVADTAKTMMTHQTARSIANRKTDTSNLEKWLQNMDGNPNKKDGSDGASQNKSTTTVGLGGD